MVNGVAKAWSGKYLTEFMQSRTPSAAQAYTKLIAQGKRQTPRRFLCQHLLKTSGMIWSSSWNSSRLGRVNHSRTAGMIRHSFNLFL